MGVSVFSGRWKYTSLPLAQHSFHWSTVAVSSSAGTPIWLARSSMVSAE